MFVNNMDRIPDDKLDPFGIVKEIYE